MVGMPFTLGKFQRSKANRPAKTRGRIGIRGSLFLAFAAIAGVALIISTVASLQLGQLGRTTDHLSGVEIPRLRTAFELAALSQILVSRAPSLLQAVDENSRQEQIKALKAAQDEVADKIKVMRELGADKGAVDAFEADTIAIGQTIETLATAAKSRIDRNKKRDQKLSQMRKEHAAFQSVIMAALEKAKSDVRSSIMKDAFGEASKAMHSVDIINDLLTNENAVVIDLSSSISASSVAVLNDYKSHYKENRRQFEDGIKELETKYSPDEIAKAAAPVMDQGEGNDSVFGLHADDLYHAYSDPQMLENTRQFFVDMDDKVKELVKSVQDGTAASTNHAHGLISFATATMIAMGLGTLIGSSLFVWLYVGRNILRRIANLQSVMTRLAAGDLEAEVAASRAQDEVAAMARSLEVFRESMIQSRAFSAEQDKDRVAKAERTAKLEARVASFEATVRSALDTLSTAANAMQSTAENMSASADKSSTLATVVASAAEQTSVNVQTVSSGTEELSSSILEISRQVSNSTAVAAKAVTEAGQTDSTMQGLADGASRISMVVDLIQNIASQTNLLALNATIEAARAGESGRGFAVVAAEVKSLADQTAKATDEIRSQIITMQSVTTSAVDAIRHIGQTIGEINEVTTAIAAAVEEQGAATREIARNIQHAANGTTEVSSNIVGVSQASADAGSAAADVLTASSALRREADGLRHEIDSFLIGIRAA